jgi:hypothetical protein
MPGPQSGEPFEIQAIPDDTPQAAGREHPWNCQPIAWYVDLYKGQLGYWRTHGIKLVLTCTDTCLVQDIKHLWFKTQHEPVI